MYLLGNQTERRRVNNSQRQSSDATFELIKIKKPLNIKGFPNDNLVEAAGIEPSFRTVTHYYHSSIF